MKLGQRSGDNGGETIYNPTDTRLKEQNEKGQQKETVKVRLRRNTVFVRPESEF